MKNFYHLLQSDADVLWGRFRKSEALKGKMGYFWLISLRAFLVVAFSILVVQVVTRLFGDVFLPMAISLVIMILTYHFVPHGYCIKDSLWTLAVLIGILIFVPTLTLYVPAGFYFLIHLIALTVVLSITCQNPQNGLGGMIGLIYAFLMRDPVEITLLPKQIGMFVLCFAVLALIMIHQHRKKDADIRYFDYIKHFSIHDPRCLWLIRMVIGMTVVLSIGMMFTLPRFTWAAFACSTILARYPFNKDKEWRIWERIEGIAIGCVGFFIVAQFVPQDRFNLIGLVSGFVLGYFYQYRAKTIIICFAPLTVATPLYGIEGASLLRIVNNVVGAVFATLLVIAFDRWVVKRLVKEPDELSPETST